MIDPTADDLGRTVRYTPRGHDPGNTGVLKGFNRHPGPGDHALAWVSFRTDQQDIAVSVADLSWTH